MATACASALTDVSAASQKELEALTKEQAMDPNAQIQEDAHAVQMALEMFAVDNRGHYPLVDSFIHDICQNEYLEENQVPRNPWSNYELHQSNVIRLPLVNSPLNHVVDGEPSPIGAVVGPGKKPFNSVFELTTYGAIIYDYDASSQRYILYAIGEQGGTAVVKLEVNNY